VSFLVGGITFDKILSSLGMGSYGNVMSTVATFTSPSQTLLCILVTRVASPRAIGKIPQRKNIKTLDTSRLTKRVLNPRASNFYCGYTLKLVEEYGF